MSDATLEKFSCDACARTYSWKQQLAGKRVKCKCGTVMTVPAALAPENSDFGPDDDGFDLDALARADARAVESTANLAAEARIIPMASPVAAAPRLSAAPPMTMPLGYRSGRQQEREAQLKGHLMDMTRDVYAPLSLMVVGFLLCLAACSFEFKLGAFGIGFVSVGIGAMTVIKAIMLIVFALLIAGPVGVSFGGVWTAILKLATIAVVTDGVTAWLLIALHRGIGGLGMYLITWPASLAVYWGLMTYLFSMDVADARTVVALLAVFDRIVKTLVVVLLASAFGLGAFGQNSPASSSTAGFGAATARPRHSVYTDEVPQYKEFKQWREARKYIADGHQGFLADTVEKMYAAGAPEIGFEVSKDINGHGDPIVMLVAMPDSPAARKKILQLRHDVYAANQMGTDPSDLIDHPDDDWIPVDLR